MYEKANTPGDMNINAAFIVFVMMVMILFSLVVIMSAMWIYNTLSTLRTLNFWISIGMFLCFVRVG